MRRIMAVACVVCAAMSSVAGAADADLKVQAADALRKAVTYFRTEVACEGGYLWRYSADLKRREGENVASPTTVWVQPFGTPSVGLAYLEAWGATRDRFYLDAACDVARCLVRGQLQSGGWDYQIEFDTAARRQYAYRVDGRSSGRNATVLDDNNTQEAVRLLMRVDKALADAGDTRGAAVHKAAQYALARLIAAQYPNGAWPQRFTNPPDPAKFPVKKASYPDTWSRTFPGANYEGFYTFNDNTISDVIDVMLEAAGVYGEAKYRAAAEKAGDFILLAQMPDPQPAWAQQYDREMHPAWARKFEPPGITGSESFGVMQSLLRLYRETGEERFRAPIPKALDYFDRSKLPDGRLARFYELQTNKPLYMTKAYKLTYDGSDVPTHYSFMVASRVDEVRKEYDRLRAMTPADRAATTRSSKPVLDARLIAETKSVIAALDARGRWVQTGALTQQDYKGEIIDTQTFVRNVRTLSRYLAASR